MLPLGEPFYSLHAVSRFRQEARELWDYFVCDNLVYAPEKFQANPLSQLGYLEQYLSGDMWFEILFGFCAEGHLHTMCAILESFYTSTPSGEGGHGQANGDACEKPMFVGIPEQVQNPQLGILRGVPSVIRLNSLDDLRLLESAAGDAKAHRRTGFDDAAKHLVPDDEFVLARRRFGALGPLQIVPRSPYYPLVSKCRVRDEVTWRWLAPLVRALHIWTWPKHRAARPVDFQSGSHGFESHRALQSQISC